MSRLDKVTDDLKSVWIKNDYTPAQIFISGASWVIALARNELECDPKITAKELVDILRELLR